jgi:polyphosphate glucokinase
MATVAPCDRRRAPGRSVGRMHDDEDTGPPAEAAGRVATGASPGAGTTAAVKTGPLRPFTLGIDIGGTGLKASVLDADAAMVADRVKVLTTYPMPPDKLVATLTKLVAPLPAADRASVGFPGMVREGLVLSAPHFSTKHGPGSAVDPDLLGLWTRFDLATALAEAFSLPTKVANDADIQGAAVVGGHGLELVVTLGTGFGTGLFYRGQLMPHLEIAHQPFRKGETYNQQLGEAARKEIGEERWNKRVQKAITILRALFFFDHLYIGGGNSRRVYRQDLDDDITIVDNTAGIVGGVRLWAADHVGVNEVPAG